MSVPLLTIVVPVYNEVKTIGEILSKINSVNIDKEIIVVDNYSTDGTRDALQDILRGKVINNIKVIYHSYNKGKGTAVREGIREAGAELVVIQDADLEYDPAEYLKLIEPLRKDEADIVLGARFMQGHSGLVFHRLGNKFLTGLLNFLFASRINDYATCYKMARKSVFLSLGLKSTSFDIEVEIVCKALKKHLRISEVPIAYYPRSYSEGKKIRWIDGFQAIISILKYRF
ncbi:MAG: glycosyltransferase family 2 protein [Candidatus Omnitrophica bacterium]|nr:glycosyltransferase family 2 protein [Candidatus Omnitrophota bacterium]